jgi:hypothetical protein
MRKCGLMLLAIALCLAASTAGASAAMSPVTIATFADPGTTSFIFTAGVGVNGLGQLNGQNNDIKLDIINGPAKLPGNVIEYPNASFKMTDMNGDLLDVTAILYNFRNVLLKAEFESGRLEFYDDSNDGALILGAVFTSAKLAPSTFGSKFSISNIVDFYGPANLVPDDTQGTFSFALATVDRNDAFLKPIKSFNATASFNCSAIAVPEPGTLILVGAGLFGLAGVTRRKFYRA